MQEPEFNPGAFPKCVPVEEVLVDPVSLPHCLLEAVFAALLECNVEGAADLVEESPEKVCEGLEGELDPRAAGFAANVYAAVLFWVWGDDGVKDGVRGWMLYGQLLMSAWQQGAFGSLRVTRSSTS